jgi:hydrogenase maturation protease
LLTSDTLVIGVGNTILSDDGVGVHAARLLQSDPRLPEDVTVLDGGTIGLELLPYACEAGCILLLDAINKGGAPGTIWRIQARDLLNISAGSSVHQLGVADLVAALALVSAKPQDIVLLGVQPAYAGWGTTLTPTVEAVLSRLVELALEQLRVWKRCGQVGVTKMD